MRAERRQYGLADLSCSRAGRIVTVIDDDLAARVSGVSQSGIREAWLAAIVKVRYVGAVLPSRRRAWRANGLPTGHAEVEVLRRGPARWIVDEDEKNV